MYLLAKSKNKDHVSCLSSSAFKSCWNYFKFQSLNKEGKTRNSSKSLRLYRGKLGIFSSPRAYTGWEDSEFLQVTEAI